MQRSFHYIVTLFLAVAIILPSSGLAQALPSATPESVGTVEIVPAVDATTVDTSTSEPEELPTESMIDGTADELAPSPDMGESTITPESVTPSTNPDPFSVTQDSTPAITLSSSFGPAYAQITVTGESFAPDEQVAIWWGSIDTGFWMGTAGTRPNGTFRIDTGTPSDATPGTYTIFAVGDNGYSASASFQITAHAMNADVTEAGIGQDIVISGYGLLPGSEVAIKWDAMFGWPIYSGSVDSQGMFSGTIQVPSDATIGPAIIFIQNGWLAFELNVLVTSDVAASAMTISPTSGFPGDSLTVSGSHFAADGLVTIRWADKLNGEIIGSVLADRDGNFLAEVLIPTAAAVGPYSIFASDTNGAEAEFLIEVSAPEVPVLSLSAESGQEGATLVATGTGYVPGETISIRWMGLDGRIIGTATTDGAGDFKVDIVIPDLLEKTTYTIYAASINGIFGSATYQVTAWVTPSIQLSPASGDANSTINVTGDGYRPNESVSIRWMSFQGTMLTTTTANSTGSINTSFVIPTSTSPGTYSIYSRGTSRQTANTPLHVTQPVGPTIQISPSSGEAGSTVTVTGTGYLPNESVSIRWMSFQGSMLTTTTANSSGNISTSFRIPGSMSPGTYSIYSRSTSRLTANTPLQVTGLATPTIHLSPTSGAPGASIKVTGSGYRPNESVTIRWQGFSGTMLKSTTANSSGNISTSFVIPNSTSPGTYSIYTRA